MHDDFFVLWRDHDGGVHRTWLRGVLVSLLLGAVGVGVALPALQRTVNQEARFEYGTTRAYEGVLVGEPVPLLVTEERVYFLVDPFKHGFDPRARESSSGRRVRLEATLIERGEQAMLEVVSGSVEARGESPSGLRTSAPETATLRGEIVDSKCYLGVMNPGHLKPHRACAINCLRGGIPPVLLSHAPDGSARQTVLVSADGVPLRNWILPFVAEPVELTGELQTMGPIEVMRVKRTGMERLRSGG